MDAITQADFWEGKYQTGTTRWDLGEATPPLVSLLNSPLAPPPGKTAVLGCGRGYEAIFLASKGFEVVGVDFAPSAIAAATAKAETAGVEVKFLQRDIFQLPEELPQEFDYVVEHTCFCAIAPEKRPDYVEVAASLLKPAGKLIAIFFTHSRPGGPPFGSNLEELRRLFTPQFKILRLEAVPNSVPSRQGEEHLAIFEKCL